MDLNPAPETTHDIIEDNVERLMKTFWGVDECTATVERDLGNDDYQLYATYEGEIESRNERFIFREDDRHYQTAQIEDDKGPNTVEVLYIFVSEANASDELLKELTDSFEAQDV